MTSRSPTPPRRKGGHERREVFAALPTPNLDCWFYGTVDPSSKANDISLPSGLVSLEITALRLTDLDHDGVDDLVVEVAFASRRASGTLDLQAGAICKKDPAGRLGSLLPPPTKARLEFLSEGSRMRPTDATTKLLAGWRAKGF